MKEFMQTIRFKILVVILAILIGFSVAAIYNEGSASIISNIVGAVLTPLQKGSASISHSASSWFQRFTDYDAVYEENQRLQKEVQEMRMQLADYNTVKHENQQYSKIIDTLESHEDWKVTPATVISRGTQSRFYSFTIDKGYLNDIEYLDPVMSADGLVGYIVEVGATYSKVFTILDVKTDVGVYISSSREIGVLTGTVDLSEDGLSCVEYLSRDSGVKEGDMILTSGSLTGGTSIYPRDVYVGKVVRVEEDGYKTSLRAIVEPAADIQKLHDVFVITDFEGQGQQ